jgi:hypothetical protein
VGHNTVAGTRVQVRSSGTSCREFDTAVDLPVNYSVMEIVSSFPSKLSCHLLPGLNLRSNVTLLSEVINTEIITNMFDIDYASRFTSNQPFSMAAAAAEGFVYLPQIPAHGGNMSHSL